MMQRMGKEQILALLLARAPDRAVDSLAATSAEDVADLIELRNALADVALSGRLPWHRLPACASGSWRPASTRGGPGGRWWSFWT